MPAASARFFGKESVRRQLRFHRPDSLSTVRTFLSVAPKPPPPQNHKWVSHTVQQVKVLATKPSNPGSVPETHMEEGEN